MAEGSAEDEAQGRKGGPRRRQRLSLFQMMRNNFLTGLVVVAPVVLTFWVTYAFIAMVDAQVMPLVPSAYNPRTYFGSDIPGYGVVVFLVFTTIVGWFAKKVFGKQLILFGESIVDRTPVVRSIYTALKQIVETVLSQSKTSFRQACLIEYPRRGVWSIGFVATDTTGEIAERTDNSGMLSIFLPTTPNPTSGYLLFVPREDVVLLDMTIEEAAKMVISAGLVAPPSKAELAARSDEAKRRRTAFARAVSPNLDD